MPPTPDETEAAAGRLRRLKAGEAAGGRAFGEAYGDTYDDCDSTEGEDRRTLADAWLADHPAGDAAGIDAAWVRATLPAPPAGRGWAGCDGPLGRVVWIPDTQPNEFTLPVWVNGSPVLAGGLTRGQFRRLLAALGAGLPTTGGGS